MAVYRIWKLFLFPLFFLACEDAGAQVIGLSKSIGLSAGFVSLDSVLRIASKQAGVVFSYNSKKINGKQRVNWGSTVTLAQLLNRLEQHGLKIKIIENYIVLAPHADQNPSTIIEESESLTTSPTIRKIKNPQETKSRAGDTPIRGRDAAVGGVAFNKFKLDSFPVVKTLAPLHVAKLKGLKIVSAQSVRKSKTIDEKAKKSKAPTYFGQCGLSIDETTPLGATFQFGFPWLFASLSGNTSFSSSQFRFGLGTSIKATDKTRIVLNFSYGNVERSGQFRDTMDVTNSIRVRSSLTRASVALEFPITKKLKVQVGPLFNFLQTSYYINSRLSSLQLFEAHGDQLFYAIKPPYLITNTFSPTRDSNTKTWIGFQVNFYYMINFRDR